MFLYKLLLFYVTSLTFTVGYNTVLAVGLGKIKTLVNTLVKSLNVVILAYSCNAERYADPWNFLPF